jgi:hypothetical protein
MTFQINDFLSRGLKHHGARPTNFEVQFAAPTSIGGINILEGARFLCNAAELPPSSIAPVEVGYFGRRLKVKGDRIFYPWNVQIMNDEDFAMRSLLEAWHNGINAIQANFMTLPTEAGPTSYKQDLIVKQFSKDGYKTREYILIGAFPTNIGPIRVNWNEMNVIEQYEVEFAYDYWLHNDGVRYPLGQSIEYNTDPTRPESA